MSYFLSLFLAVIQEPRLWEVLRQWLPNRLECHHLASKREQVRTDKCGDICMGLAPIIDTCIPLTRVQRQDHGWWKRQRSALYGWAAVLSVYANLKGDHKSLGTASCL